MKTERSSFATPYMFCIVAALTLVGSAAWAQETKVFSPEAPTARPSNTPTAETSVGSQAPVAVVPQSPQEAVAEDEELFYAPLQVGDATKGLLDWQSSGENASSTPRPISGVIANRSYERYLKSFEFPIPERMTSSVKSTSSGSAGK